jgi:hypothetical protein
MTSPALPNADELEVVAWLDPVPMANGYRVAITAQPIVDRDQWLPCVTLSSAQAQIERLTRERDEAAEVERDNEAGLIAAHSLKEEVKRLREALEQLADQADHCVLGVACKRNVEDAVQRLAECSSHARTALSGGTSNG